MQRVDHAIEKLCANVGSSLTHTKRLTQSGCVWTVTLADCSALVSGELPTDKGDWDTHCARYGFAPADRMCLFQCPRSFRTFQLVSLSKKSPKYPVIALGSQGGRYGFHPSDVTARSALPSRGGGNATAAAGSPAQPKPSKPPTPESPDPMEVTDEPDWDLPDNAKVLYSSLHLLHAFARHCVYVYVNVVILQAAASDSDCDIPLRQLQTRLKAKRDAQNQSTPQKRQRSLKECAENWKRKNQRKLALQRAGSVEAQAINVDDAPAPAKRMSQKHRKFLQEAVLVSDVGWSWEESELYDDEKLRDLFEAVGCGDPDLAWEEHVSMYGFDS